ncbi:MAG: Rqc2 family fibronectin-binding protein [Acholeplasmataceae bacterium]|jgi:predicted ribosome quality control (RQC) complex YloA/Tae2 family protein
MAFDGYFISKLVNEIKPKILNKRVDKVFQDENYLQLKLQREYLTFTISGQMGMFYLSDDSINNLDYEFAKVLRKNLLGYRLRLIEQVSLDRIVIFEFEGIDLIKGPVKRKLILEAYGRNFNLILTEANDIIISAYRLIHNLENKTILPNVKYEIDESDKLLLENNSTLHLDYEEIKNKYLGVSPLLGKYLQSKHINLDEIKINPVKNLDNNQFYWFNLFETENVKVYDSLSSLIGDLRVSKKVNKKPYEKFIKNESVKLQNKLIKLADDLKKHESNILLKNIADRIYSSALDLNTKASNFEGVTLDVNLTLNENAQKFYSQYKKAKSGLDYAQNEIEKANLRLEVFDDLKETLEYLDSEEELKDFAEALTDYGYKLKTFKRKKKDEPNITKVDYLGSTILIGKNSKQNEYIFSKLAKNDDMWLHVKAGTGAHVIIKGEHTPKIIEKAAQYAAFYSSYKHSSNIPVDYTLVRYVTKVRKSETFKTTYTNYKTIYINEVSMEILTNH